MPIDPMIAASLLRGGATPAAEAPTDDRAALISALRRHGDIGMLMNLEPTAAVGRALHERATGYEAQARYEQALRRQEAQAQAQAQRYAAEQAMRERDYQLRAHEAQRRAEMAERDSFQPVVDPITGKSSVFNRRTGEFMPVGQDTGQAQAAPAPGEGEQDYGFSGVPASLPFKTEGQSLNYGLANNMAKNLYHMEKMLSGDWRPSKLDAIGSGPEMGGVLGAVQGPLTRWVGSEEGASYYTAAKSLLDNIMKKMQGDTYTTQQYENAVRTYIPGPGDSDEVIQQKTNMLKNIIDSTAVQSGPAAAYWRKAFRESIGPAGDDMPPAGAVQGQAPGQPAPGSTRDNPIELD